MGMERVKNHFETAVENFDRQILKLIPCYDEMMAALVSAIPFGSDDFFQMMDLGSGTGSVSRKVLDRFPNVSITCLDISEKILQMAKCKLGENVAFVAADFTDYEFTAEYDVIASSLALHHLETEEKLQNFYGKIFGALKPHGIFINIDVVLGGDSRLQETYMEKWVEFMEKSLDPEEVRGKVLADYRAEDRPVRLTQHL